MCSVMSRLGAVLLIGGAASLASAGGPSFIGGLNTITAVASTVPANGDVNPYGVAVVPDDDRQAGPRPRSGQQLQQRRQPAGHGHDHRAGRAGRQHGTLRPDRRRTHLPGLVSRWRRLDHRARRAALGLGDRGQPAHHRRHSVHRRGRLPDRARQPRSSRRDLLRGLDQRPLGHDRARRGRRGACCSSATCSTARWRPDGDVVNAGTVVRIVLAVPDRGRPVAVVAPV